MKSDYHIHTTFSPDSIGIMENYVTKAIELGFEEICFTDHWEPWELIYHKEFHFDYPKYRIEIDRLKQLYPQIKLKIGVEVGFYEPAKKDIIEFLTRYKFDYVLGSIHTLTKFKEMQFDDYYMEVASPSAKLFYQSGKITKEAVYDEYFRLLKQCVETNFFDAIAHFDIPKRYIKEILGELDIKYYRPVIEDILSLLIKNKKILEINCSGYRNEGKLVYPSNEILKIYKELGGEYVTIGSDSHRLEHLGITEQYTGLKKLGLKIASFEQRKLCVK
jgi:histidinol-phosphatase (PHP family)